MNDGKWLVQQRSIGIYIYIVHSGSSIYFIKCGDIEKDILRNDESAILISHTARREKQHVRKHDIQRMIVYNVGVGSDD